MELKNIVLDLLPFHSRLFRKGGNIK